MTISRINQISAGRPDRLRQGFRLRPPASAGQDGGPEDLRDEGARPATPGIWLVVLFVFVSGMAFSSSAETDRTLRSPKTLAIASSGTASLHATVPPTPWARHPDDTSTESRSLALLGMALIGAAGCWRRVLRHRQQAAPLTMAPAPAPVTHLRAVPRPRLAS